MTTTYSIPIEERLSELRSEIGDTPLLRFRSLEPGNGSRIYGKAEWLQAGGSVKARAAYQILLDAVSNGLLENRILLDASSGNTGIAYAYLCRQIGLDCVIVLPANASPERKKILNQYHAKVIETSPFGGTDEAQEKAAELARDFPDKYFYADQYRNNSNWQAHLKTTGPEIWHQTNGEITHFVTGLGTTGTFTGTTKYLKKAQPIIRCVSLQPDGPLHALEGWKHMETAINPAFYDPELADENREINSENAIATLKTVMENEGLNLSPSASANLWGAQQIANENSESTVVTILPDNADKYQEELKQWL